MLLLVWRAHILNVGQSKVEDRNLNEARKRGCNNLSHEHRAGWDLFLELVLSCNSVVLRLLAFI